jgi:predicted TIM-barrel fold metal-dependent hydrolase
MIDEWCAAAPERMIPLVLMPYWDQAECVQETERTASKGAKAISFIEAPHSVGLPSFHTDHWDRFLATVAAAKMPLCLHFGSGGPPPTAPDGPFTAAIALYGLNSLMTTVELLNSRIFEKFPDLKVALSEGGIGWMPYVLERTDYTWERHRYYTGMANARKPSEIFRDHIFGCFISDNAGLHNLDLIGEDNVMFEGDYPHSDSNWPHARKMLEESLAELPDDVARKISEGNARKLFNFPRSG